MSVSTFFVGPKNSKIPFTVTATDRSGSGAGFAACGNVSTSGGTAPVISGGVGPFTYAWAQTGTPAESGPFSISSLTANNPSWSDNRCASYNNNSETWQLTVTDSNSDTAVDTITVTLDWIDLT